LLTQSNNYKTVLSADDRVLIELLDVEASDAVGEVGVNVDRDE